MVTRGRIYAKQWQYVPPNPFSPYEQGATIIIPTARWPNWSFESLREAWLHDTFPTLYHLFCLH